VVAEPVRRRVVHVHVGAPKTGTTLVQDLLYANRSVLREHGVLIPGTHRYAAFHAAVDLLDISWGGVLDTARGSFDAVMAEIASWPGDVVLSNENLALAVDKRVRRIRAALPEHELRVVYSARDFARQVPAAWQERIRHAYTDDFGTFVHRLREEPDEMNARRFWRCQTWPDVLERWTRCLDATTATLVTVPPAGTDPEVLLGRFLDAFGVDPAWLPDRDAARPNPGLDPVQSALLRTIQVELERRVTDGAVRREALQGAMVRRWWARHPGPGRVALPEQDRAWADQVTAGWLARLREMDLRVVGDLADLEPTASDHGEAIDPDTVGADAMLELAVRTLADALEEHQALTAERDALSAGGGQETGGARDRVERLYRRVRRQA